MLQNKKKGENVHLGHNRELPVNETGVHIQVNQTTTFPQEEISVQLMVEKQGTGRVIYLTSNMF